jgi:hypothetical protein
VVEPSLPSVPWGITITAWLHYSSGRWERKSYKDYRTWCR